MSDQVNLDGTAWRLVTWSESNIALPPLGNSTVTIHFQDKAIGGSTGCNQYFGTYDTEDEHIAISILGSSRKLCTDKLMQHEGRYLTALGTAKNYQISKAGQVQITYSISETTGLMTFDRILP